MNDSKNRRCGECGSTNTGYKESKGPFRWKDFRYVELKQPIELLTCSACKKAMYLPSDPAKVDQAASQVIAEQSRIFIEAICERGSCSEIALSEVLGVTPEHLSAMKSGNRTPSFQTFNFLKTLALAPRAFQIANPLNFSRGA